MMLAHDRRSEVFEQRALGVLQLVQPLHQVIVGSLEFLHAFGELAVLCGEGRNIVSGSLVQIGEKCFRKM